MCIRDRLPRWTEAGDAPPQDLLDANGLIAITTGEIPAMAQQGNPFAPPPALLQDARTAEPGAVFGEVYEQAGTLWVAQLVTRSDPDEALYEAQKSELSEPVLAMKRNVFFTGWVADAKARASIQ